MNDIKIRTDLYSVLSQSKCLTDRRTDGQTDRILIATPRLHCMQHGKNKHFTTKFCGNIINKMLSYRREPALHGAL